MGVHFHKGAMQRYHSWLSLGQRMVDALLVFIVLAVLCYIHFGGFPRSFQLVAVLGAMLTWISMGAVDAYRGWRGSSLWREIRVLLFGWFLVALSLLVLAWAGQYGDDFSRIVIGLWFVLSPVCFVVLRLSQRTLLRFFVSKGAIRELLLL